VKFSQVPVKDDGNCLFSALSYNMYGSTDLHANIRRIIADWLEMNSEFMVCFFSFPLSPAFCPTLSCSCCILTFNSQIYQQCDGIPLNLIEGEESWPEYVRKMGTDAIYGTISCLYAASELFSATIHIMCSENDDIHIIPQSSHVCNLFFLYLFVFFFVLFVRLVY
jgi:hypothetical protein